MAAIDALLHVQQTAAEAQQDFQNSPINSGFLLTGLLHCLSSMGCAASLGEADLFRIIERFHWHRTVLQEVAAILAGRDQASGLPSSDTYDICKHGLLSEDPVLRMTTLLLLQSGRPTSEVLRKALEVERVPLTPQDARDKNMHLRRLGIIMKSQDKVVTEELEIGLFYLIAMLKVNFKPLWSEAIEVIAGISEAQPSVQALIWQILSKELHQLAEVDMRASAPLGVPHWGLAFSDSSVPSSVASWRQDDLSCTTFTRWSGVYLHKVHHFLELSKAESRTLDQRHIQVGSSVVLLACFF